MVDNECDSQPESRPGIEGTTNQSNESITKIGNGEIGGKAQGLKQIERILANRFSQSAYPSFKMGIPWFWVVAAA